jgi:predicted nucleic-acid-binding Zn-ribbon protein
VKNGICPKCQGTVIVQGVRVLDRGHGNTVRDLSVAVYAKPDAWMFRGEVKGELWACVCGVCGYTELYATNLDELVRAAAQRQAREVPSAEPPAANDGADE